VAGGHLGVLRTGGRYRRLAVSARRVIELAGHIAYAVPPDRHVRFLADGFAHSASYVAGFLGGMVVIAHVWRSRAKLADAAR
jgi:hypothetical protein